MPTGGASRRRGRRVLQAAVALLAVLATVLMLVRALNRGREMRDAFPAVEGTLPLAGLSKPVAVTRDPRGIPHLEAAGESDAYRALGFVHAQERLAQMEWLRRSARGRLAEVLGSRALAADRESRVLGIAQHAERSVGQLPARTRSLLRAYTEGVEARQERIRSGLDASPVALRGLPLEPWTEADSVAIVKLYAWALAGHLDAGVVLQDLIELLGGFGARPFFPPGVGVESLEAPAETAALAAPRRPMGSRPALGTDALRRLSGLVGRSLGSSAFVISGRHTRSGRPILAADAHLPPRAPSLFYQAHLGWPGGLVAGATIPGVPLFWTGHNGRVAWSAIHAGATVTDLYVETVHADGARYHDGRRWRDLGTRQEEIAVRGQEPETLVVQETRHGPLLTPLVADDREPLALAWSGARRGDPLSGLLAVTRAANGTELRAALERHHEPAVVVVYADREGSAGFQMAGWIPRRSLPTGLVPMPGRNRWYGWGEGVPYGLLPHRELGEQDDFAVAADARLAPDEPVVIEWLWRTGSRSERLAELLGREVSAGPVELRGAAAVQRDVSSPGAPGLVRAALRLAGAVEELGKEERWVAQVLESWDGASSSESVGATVYHVFLNQLLDALLEPWVGSGLEDRYLAIPHVDPVYLAQRLL
ncbi:MAG: penicillin acylase family protein, partial [Myxococcota bacterium]